MSGNDNEHFDFVLATFEISGLKTRQKSTLTNSFQKFIAFPILLTLFALICINLFHVESVLEMTENLQSLSTYGHGVMRKIVILRYGGIWEELHSDRAKFWKYDLFGREFGEEFRRKMSIVKYFCLTLPTMTVFVAIYFTLSPVIYKEQNLPQPCWVPKPEYTPIIYFFQTFYIFEVAFMDCFVDSTFLLMCGELEIQFLLLKKTLQSVKIGENSSSEHEERCFDVLKTCTAHHLFLTDVHGKLNTGFSLFFFFQYLMTIEGICVQIYTINEVDLTWDQMVTAVIYIVAVLAQCCYGFLSASNVEVEVDDLGDEIYEIDWYNARNGEIPKHILFMIMNAQKPLYITGEGLFKVNRTTLLQIIRLGFSISTLLMSRTS